MKYRATNEIIELRDALRRRSASMSLDPYGRLYIATLQTVDSASANQMRRDGTLVLTALLVQAQVNERIEELVEAGAPEHLASEQATTEYIVEPFIPADEEAIQLAQEELADVVPGLMRAISNDSSGEPR